MVLSGGGTLGCGEPPSDQPFDGTVAVTTLALDNAPTSGKQACYVDGPLVDKEDRPAKGEMRGEMCCIVRDSGTHCYECTDDFECQKGGGEVGARVVDVMWVGSGGTTGLAGTTTAAPKTVTRATRFGP